MLRRCHSTRQNKKERKKKKGNCYNPGVDYFSITTHFKVFYLISSTEAHFNNDITNLDCILI